MQSFHVNSFGAAIILSTLLMGALGAFVLIPIACIQWAWNALAPGLFSLPVINVWQAILLYTAGATILFLSGLVQIEVKSETLD